MAGAADAKDPRRRCELSRRKCPLPTCCKVGIVVSFIAVASTAWAATPHGDEARRCGISAREAISTADKALAEKSPEAEHRAILCLLAAVKALEAQRLDVVRGKDKAHLLTVPRGP